MITRDGNITSLFFIINPQAGKGNYQNIIDIIDQTLGYSEIRYDFCISEGKDHAISMSREVSSEYSAVVAVGGDGTINGVLNGIVGSECAFGILPAGTGNGFARQMGIPVDPEEACEILKKGAVVEMDIGEVNGRYFLNTAGVGFDAMISKFSGETFGPLRGMWLYFATGFLAFIKYLPPLVDIDIDSEKVQFKPLLISVTNTGRYGGEALVVPGALPDDGFLDVCVIQKINILRLLYNLPKLFTGEHIELPYVHVYRGNSISINSIKPLPAHVDGEAIGEYSEIVFKTIPKALKVIVPDKKDKGIRVSQE
ncbi:YegS/Rv2252/BmrU family lipid kinase [Candidatus Poribacteria bacterium]|nr:YegS/Rv2252/BmrU family lipid kinase [Candidatus Poribacteria bacterium]